MNQISRDRQKRTVKVGISSLEIPMTYKQALRYGKNAMPADLKRAGFVCEVGRSDRELHGGEWYRIDYVLYFG